MIPVMTLPNKDKDKDGGVLLNRAKIILITLLVISGCFDLLSTLWHPNFLGLESNFGFVMSGMTGLYLLCFFKVSITLFFVIVLFKTNTFASTDFTKFFYVHIIILLVFIQLFAGFNNMLLKEKVVEKSNEVLGTNYTSPSEVPKAVVQEFVPENEDKLFFYFQTMGLILYLPLFLGLVSFKFWEWCFRPRRVRVDGIEYL